MKNETVLFFWNQTEMHNWNHWSAALSDDAVRSAVREWAISGVSGLGGKPPAALFTLWLDVSTEQQNSLRHLLFENEQDKINYIVSFAFDSRVYD